MLHGSCRLDYMTSMPKVRVPFELSVKPMVCFKSWIKTLGHPKEHLVQMPSKIDILDFSAVIQGYGNEEVLTEDQIEHNKADKIAMGEGEVEEEEEELTGMALQEANLQLCFTIHIR